MKAKSYPMIASSIKTLQILKFIGGKMDPVDTDSIVQSFDLGYPSIMTHLATLEREGMVERVGNGFVVGTEAARLFATRKSIIERKQREIDTERVALNI